MAVGNYIVEGYAAAAAAAVLVWSGGLRPGGVMTSCFGPFVSGLAGCLLRSLVKKGCGWEPC